jgi:hypothetical protein
MINGYINGYKIPGGIGGLTVRVACSLVENDPGIKQSDLLRDATSATGLNHSTASWIVSPSDKSPATKLWDRVKMGRGFCLFPNEHTKEVARTAKDAHRDLHIISLTSAKSRFIKDLGREPKVGELIKFDRYPGSEGKNASVVGFYFSRDGQQKLDCSDTIDEAIQNFLKNDKPDVYEQFLSRVVLSAVLFTQDSKLIRSISSCGISLIDT